MKHWFVGTWKMGLRWGKLKMSKQELHRIKQLEKQVCLQRGEIDSLIDVLKKSGIVREWKSRTRWADGDNKLHIVSRIVFPIVSECLEEVVRYLNLTFVRLPEYPHRIIVVDRDLLNLGAEKDFTIAEYRYYQHELELQAPAFVETILGIENITSVVELGCGLGIILREFAKQGVKVIGYEKSIDAIKNTEAPERSIFYRDLRNPWIVTDKYDLCICTEVVEHLESEYAFGVIRCITNLSDLVYFTAASPEQKGKNHVNLQSFSYWEKIFNHYGFYYDDLTTRVIKVGMKQRAPDINKGHRLWYNGSVYRKSTK